MENLSDNRDGIKENLSLTPNSTDFLLETAKWSHFLAILGYIFVALLVLLGLFAGTIFSFIPQTEEIPFNMGGVIGIVYTVMAAIYFFPVYFLHKFSTKLKSAIKSYKDEELEIAFKNLKSHYKFIGIITIIFISLYVVGIVISISASIIGLL